MDLKNNCNLYVVGLTHSRPNFIRSFAGPKILSKIFHRTEDLD